MPPKRIQDQETPQTSKPAKRPKASRACTTCRKTKSRCELLDAVPTNNGRLQCHRCKVLNIECSFQNSDIIILSNGLDAGGRSVVSTSAATSSTTTTLLPRSPSPQSAPLNEQFGVRKDELCSDSSDPDDAEYLLLAPWRLLSIGDDVGWTTSPILSVQRLVKSASPSDGHKEPLKEAYTDTTLASILTLTQIDYLIDIFETRYRPWMNLPQSRTNNIALDLVRCAVASRHLDSHTRAEVSPRLQSLVERTLLQPGYSATMTLEFVEALLILALWTPICGDGYAIARDNRLLATSAMEIAINKGLSRYDDVQVLQKRKPSAPQPDPVDVNRTRLWCAATNIERMLLLGTGRQPQSPSSPEAHRLDFTHAFNAGDTRDTRLVLYRRLFDIVDAGTSVHWDSSPEGLQRSCREVDQLLPQFGWLSRSLRPLPIVSAHDSVYFHMVHVVYHVCKITTLHSFLCGLRRVSDHKLRHKQWMMESINGLPVVSIWGQDYVCSTEAALLPFLTCTDVSSLSTAPDNYFILLAYAAISIITTKVSVHQLGFPPLSGSADELITMTIDRLQQVALSPDHMPAKCAAVVREANATWERKKKEPLGVLLVPSRSSWTPSPQPVEGGQGDEGGAHLDYSNVPSPPGIIPDYFGGFGDATIDPGLLFDPQFWSEFLDNLKS